MFCNCVSDSLITNICYSDSLVAGLSVKQIKYIPNCLKLRKIISMAAILDCHKFEK